MRKVRVQCGTCGEVVVGADEIELTGSAPHVTRLSFDCPVCLSAQTRTCTSDAARLLLLSGARTAVELPAQSGPAFTEEDVRELHRQLNHPAWPTLLRGASGS